MAGIEGYRNLEVLMHIPDFVARGVIAIASPRTVNILVRGFVLS